MSLVEDVSRSLPSHSHVSAVLRQEAQIPWAVAFVQPLLLDSLIESHRVAEAAGELIDALLPIVMVEQRTISVLIERERKRVALTDGSPTFFCSTIAFGPTPQFEICFGRARAIAMWTSTPVRISATTALFWVAFGL